MGITQSVESMTDEQVLSTFDTAAADGIRGFDEATHTRVMAYELIRARNRIAHYRTLYGAFIEAGKPYMIENLDEDSSNGSVPAKLVFTDDTSQLLEIEEQPDCVIWTESALLDALSQERAVHDFFTELLDELEPALQQP
jgi:hypothetical protein